MVDSSQLHLTAYEGMQGVPQTSMAWVMGGTSPQQDFPHLNQVELAFPLESLSSYKNQSDAYHRTGTELWESALHAQQASWVSEPTKISEEHNLKWDAYFLCGMAPWFIRSSVLKLASLPIQHFGDSFLWGTQKTHSPPRMAGQGQAQGAMARSTGEEKASIAKR